MVTEGFKGLHVGPYMWAYANSSRELLPTKYRSGIGKHLSWIHGTARGMIYVQIYS